jgi:hypothetical protein
MAEIFSTPLSVWSNPNDFGLLDITGMPQAEEGGHGSCFFDPSDWLKIRYPLIGPSNRGISPADEKQRMLAIASRVVGLSGWVGSQKHERGN